MYFVGMQNMTDVVPDTSVSCDVTAVAFLVWVCITAALRDTALFVSSQCCCHTTVKWGLEGVCSALWNTARCFTAAQLPTQVASNPWKLCKAMANWNCTACWEGIFHFVTWCLRSHHSQDSSSTSAASCVPEHGDLGDFASCRAVLSVARAVTATWRSLL